MQSSATRTINASPVGLLYKLHRPEDMRAIEAAFPCLENLLSARAGLAPGNGVNPNQSLFSITLEIDTAIDLLRDIDEALSDTSLLRYFHLFFFFTVLVIIIIIALRMLHARLNRAERRERQTLTFSRETIIPPDFQRRGLADTLGSFCYNFRQRTGIECQLTV